MLEATNPTNGEVLWQFSALDETELNQTIERAVAAQGQWRSKTLHERGTVLKAVAQALREGKDELAKAMALEMGKPLKEGVAEVEKSAWCAEHYAENAEQYLAREVLPSDAKLSYVSFQPLGTVLGILPWNAPVWIAFRFLAPALMAGNTCVMKHDPHVPKSAQLIVEAFGKAGAPANFVVNAPLQTPMVQKAIEHPAIAAVSFTGSSAAGAKVASMAAAQIKPSVLELGGSDPFVVLADANLEKAADVAVLSRIINAGQSCIAAKRVIVEQPVYKQFMALCEERLQKLKVGDPLDEATSVGPIAREDLCNNLDRQVQMSLEAGAVCKMGGQPIAGPGYFYPVTLLVDVEPHMCVCKEETFGPVMVMMCAKDSEHALELANDTEYGLGAGVWTENPDSALYFANALQAGQVAINGIVKTDPRLPSGGIKRSGFGRELGPYGIKEFVNAKQIWMA